MKASINNKLSQHPLTSRIAADRILKVNFSKTAGQERSYYFISESHKKNSNEINEEGEEGEINEESEKENRLENIIASCPPRKAIEENYDSYLEIGKGAHGYIRTSLNPEDKVVEKVITRGPPLEEDRFIELLKMFLTKKFHSTISKHMCVPFLFDGSGILMKKVDGKSLEELWLNRSFPVNKEEPVGRRPVELTKKAIIDLYKAMAIMSSKRSRYGIVHTDIHAGNIMLSQKEKLPLTLVLIDFDECLKRENRATLVSNPDYDEDDWGSTEKKEIWKTQSSDNPAVYVTNRAFKNLRKEMFANFKRIFHSIVYEDKPLDKGLSLSKGLSIFNDHHFLEKPDDNTDVFLVNIALRASNSDSYNEFE